MLNFEGAAPHQFFHAEQGMAQEARGSHTQPAQA